jgi:hypothetical protein
MLSRVSANLLATTTCTQSGALLTAQRLLRTTISSSSEVQGTPGGGTGAPGSKGAAPGRAAGSDEQVKFGDADACEVPQAAGCLGSLPTDGSCWQKGAHVPQCICIWQRRTEPDVQL